MFENQRLTGICLCVAVFSFAAIGCGDDSSPADGKTADGGSSHDGNAGTGHVAGDGGTGNGDSDPEVRTPRGDEVQKDLQPLLAAACEHYVSCCNADELAYQLGPSTTADNCAERLFASTMRGHFNTSWLDNNVTLVLAETPRLAQGFDFGRVSIDTKAVAACAASLSKASCMVAAPKDHCEPEPYVSDADDPCLSSKILIGSQALGDPCAPPTQYTPQPHSYDCKPGLRCQSLEGGKGVCVASAMSGDACFGDNDCDSTLLCDYATGTCIAGAAQGEACSYVDPKHPLQGTEKQRCSAGLVCDTVKLTCQDPSCTAGGNCQEDVDCPKGLTCVMYQCGQPKDPGDNCYRDTDCKNKACTYTQGANGNHCAVEMGSGTPCNSDTQCTSQFCAYDNTTQTQVCQDTVASGKACPSNDNRQCKTHHCVYDSIGAVYNCAAAAVAGDACSQDNDCGAATPLYCIASKCTKVPLANGKTCNQATQCESGVCSESKCVAKLAKGAKCAGTEAIPCDAGLFCSLDKKLCTPIFPQGKLCSSDEQCTQGCGVVYGERRCGGVARGDAFCDGK